MVALPEFVWQADGMKLERGMVIALEGIDGAGKTTQARAIAARFRSAGLTVVETKEPTNGEWGQLIRDSKRTKRLSLEEEFQAFVEDRKQHVRDVINPAVRKGQVVIVDRYYFSTAAYQGPRGMDTAEILRVNEEFAPRPDLLVVLDVPVDVGLARIKARGDVADLFERAEDLERSAEVFRSFKGDGVLHVDGTAPAESITSRVMEHFLDVTAFKAFCRKRGLDRCEPAYCIFQPTCDVIRLGQVAPFPRTLASDVA